MRAAVRRELQLGVAQLEPVGLHRHHLAAQQRDDHVERLGHHVALSARVDAEHHRVRRQQAGPDAEHRAPARQMVELRHAVGDHQRLVVGQRDDAGAEPDVLGARRDVGDEQLGAGDDLVAGGVVLADPRLVEAELVEPLDELAVALQTERRVLVDGMKRRHEDAETQTRTQHGISFSFGSVSRSSALTPHRREIRRCEMRRSAPLACGRGDADDRCAGRADSTARLRRRRSR